MTDYNSLKEDTLSRMEKTLEAMKADLAGLRAGRAHASLLDGVMVEAYGNMTPISQVGTIGVPDARYGEAVMACIILKQRQQISKEEMTEYIKSHMARHKVPQYIEFVNEFTMNAAGKVLKYKMREEATERLGLKNAAGIDTASGKQ